MGKTVKLSYDDASIELPLVEGTEGERGVDISELRSSTGLITLDEGYANTGSCESAITFINGEEGVLRYRGIPIEEIAEKSNFVETAYLLIYGDVPNERKLSRFSRLMEEYQFIHENMRALFQPLPPLGHPMGILGSMTNAIACYYPKLVNAEVGTEEFDRAVALLLSQVRAIAAYSYKHSIGQPYIYPKPNLEYPANFLHMMFSLPHKEFELSDELVRAMDLIFMLHADHEQNCSTSTVKMVGSSQANLFTSVAAGVSALWGPLHGGANQRVVGMLEGIHKRGESIESVIRKAKDKESGFRLMGFGHRVYKNFDPRAQIIKKTCDKVLDELGKDDPLLDIAKALEEAALNDSYFVDRKLFPNVDFYSGIIMRAIGIPTSFFTVMFAIGRLPGWIAQWKETRENPKGRIYRPRQVYVGSNKRTYEEAVKDSNSNSTS